MNGRVQRKEVMGCDARGKRHIILSDILPHRLAFSIDEAAQQIGKTPRAVRNLIARNFMPHRKIGRSIIIPRADLERFLTELPGLSTDDALTRVKERTQKKRRNTPWTSTQP